MLLCDPTAEEKVKNAHERRDEEPDIHVDRVVEARHDHRQQRGEVVQREVRLPVDGGDVPQREEVEHRDPCRVPARMGNAMGVSERLTAGGDE